MKARHGTCVLLLLLWLWWWRLLQRHSRNRGTPCCSSRSQFTRKPEPSREQCRRLAMADDARVEALRDELRTLDLHEAAKAIRAWLGEHSLQHGSSRTTTDSLEAIVVSPPQLAPPGEPPNAAPLTAPPAAAGYPASSNPMPRRLYDTEPVSSSRVPVELVTKPEHVFHGERDNQQRAMAPVYEFPMHVRLLTRTHAQPRRCSNTHTVLGATRAGDLRPPHVGPRVR